MKRTFFHSIPNSFLVFAFFFVAQEKIIFQNLIFLPYKTNFVLKLNFKNFKVFLEASKDVEATIMNTETLEELGI